MNLLRARRLQKHWLILGLPLMLAGLSAGAPAQVKVDDLFNSAGTGDLARVKVLLDSGTDINSKTQNGGTALAFAACFGKLDVVRLLLDKGAEINAQDNNGASALNLASEQGHLEVVWALLAKGADVNLQDNKVVGQFGFPQLRFSIMMNL